MASAAVANVPPFWLSTIKIQVIEGELNHKKAIGGCVTQSGNLATSHGTFRLSLIRAHFGERGGNQSSLL